MSGLFYTWHNVSAGVWIDSPTRGKVEWLCEHGNERISKKMRDIWLGERNLISREGLYLKQTVTRKILLNTQKNLKRRKENFTNLKLQTIHIVSSTLMELFQN
jgi:hypothetical protein